MAGFGTTLQKQGSSLFLCHADSGHEEPHYFLDSCSLCKTLLHVGDDIYMYKGDTPFCSEECRQEQIEIDEAQERKKNKNKNKKKLIKSKIDTNDTISKSKSREIPVRSAEAVTAS